MDHHYAKEKLTLLLRDLDSYTSGEFWRQMSRIAGGATGTDHAEEIARERDALAAHVVRIKDCFKSTSATLPSAWQAEMYGLFAQAPKVSLAHLKAQWQAEALDRLRELLKETHMAKAPTVTRAAMHIDDAINRVKQECRPLKLRRQAEENIT